MAQGLVMKALSGFYYVADGTGGPLWTCRARGRFRHQGQTPLVGDMVRYTGVDGGVGTLDEILPRKNQFRRPAVANIDQLILVASAAIPVTDPFLIDRVAAIAEHAGCEVLLCLNKCDLDPAEELYRTYCACGFPVVRVSAETGEGMERLSEEMAGKVSAFTGNSGVGKSSLLNRLEPGISAATGEVSVKLGRGRHTTRHVELFRLKNGAVVADTPGFSSFDLEELGEGTQELAAAFREFRPYLDRCRFAGCSHVKEKGCAVLEAVERGDIPASRHQSYVRLYQDLAAHPAWERRKPEQGSGPRQGE